ncbi:MAG: sigma-70 family RNA polymerase sigma factor [Candidatus Onthomonas sp.]
MTLRRGELLAAAQQGDKAACEILLSENDKLIWSIVKRYAGRGAETEDLFQLGCIGFLKAVQSFDPEYGTQFSTYAVPKIAGEIRRFLRDDGVIKVSRGLKEQAFQLRTSREQLANQLGRDPTLSELSARTGLSPEEIATADTASSAVTSLQSETAEGLTLESLLGDQGIEGEIVESVSLRQAVNELEERERMVILLRYFRGFTQDRTAKVIGVSQVQISRIERRAVEHLRKKLE